MIYLIALTLMLIPSTIKKQEQPYAFFKYFNECINVYKSPIGQDAVCKVFQDSINETNYYEVKLLEKSPLRFKVQIQAYDFIPPIIGWVDKECIAVYPDILHDNDGYYVLLYESPNKGPISLYLEDKFDDVFTVIDYCGKWMKIMFMMNEHLYVGWVKDFCPIIYNSCA